MTCDLDRVDALADGRLDGPEAKEVMEHLAGCPQCRAYYEGALAADRVLADTGINPPADFAAGVMERIRPRRQDWPRACCWRRGRPWRCPRRSLSRRHFTGSTLSC